MKAYEAPERIYCESDGIGNIVKVHNIKWPDDEAENIEYTRTDAFIEKTEKWIDNFLSESTLIDYKVTPIVRNAVIENFKNYIKGE